MHGIEKFRIQIFENEALDYRGAKKFIVKEKPIGHQNEPFFSRFPRISKLDGMVLGIRVGWRRISNQFIVLVTDSVIGKRNLHLIVHGRLEDAQIELEVGYTLPTLGLLQGNFLSQRTLARRQKVLFSSPHVFGEETLKRRVLDDIFFVLVEKVFSNKGGTPHGLIHEKNAIGVRGMHQAHWTSGHGIDGDRFAIQKKSF